MIRFFRLQNNSGESSSSTLKVWLFVILLILIIGSFFLQMSLGLCPVP